MKIITSIYSREKAAIIKSSLMADKQFAHKDLYRLEQNNMCEAQPHEEIRPPRQQEYIIQGIWQ